jgi:uncharacterized membrane protein YdjX (TVP38/TMEM64 family)
MTNTDQDTVQRIFFSDPEYRIVMFLIIMTIAVATTLPVNIIALAGLFIFDFYLLLCMLVISIIMGVFIMYFLAKKMGEKGFEEYASVNNTRASKIKKTMKNHRYSLMILLSFVYFFPSNMAGLTATFTKTKFSKFFWIAFCGNALNIIFFITLAKGVLIKNSAMIIASIVVLICTSILPILIYKTRIKRVIQILY